MLLTILAVLAAAAPPSFDHMNARRDPPPTCKPVHAQIAGENRRPNGNRLDQQPPGHLLYAVDRQINGCHQPALVRDEPRRR